MTHHMRRNGRAETVSAQGQRVSQRTVADSSNSFRFGLWVLGIVSGVSACTTAKETLPELPEVAVMSQAVVGGESIEACNWPSTVSVNAWGSCSGTLIHSRIVTTAAHCIANPQTNIFFGAGRGSPGSFALTADCKVGAQGARGANTGSDWAYCVLPEDARVAQIPVTPPLVGCEADKYLKSGIEAWVGS